MREPRTRLQKGFLIVLAGMTLLFAVLLGVSKSRPGVLFHKTLMEVTVLEDRTVYTGTVYGEAVTVAVLPGEPSRTTVEVDVAGRLDTYTLEYPLAPRETIHGPKDGIRILKNGEVLFEGAYDKEWVYDNAQDYGWYDQDGEWDPNLSAAVTFSGGKTSWEIGLKDTFRFAHSPALTTRGSWGLFALAVFITLLTAVEVAYPMEIFQMQHCCDVREPEPSDFYLMMLPWGWGAFTLLSLWCHVMALRTFPGT